MFFAQVLHNGSPDFMLAVLALLAALVMSQTVTGSGIAQHPYVKPGDAGELASDLPPESRTGVQARRKDGPGLRGLLACAGARSDAGSGAGQRVAGGGADVQHGPALAACGDQPGVAQRREVV
jgi:hypothetical protein